MIQKKRQIVIRWSVICLGLAILCLATYHFALRISTVDSRPTPPTRETAIWSGLVGISKDRMKVVFAVHDRAMAHNRLPLMCSRAFWKIDLSLGRVKILDEGHIIAIGEWHYLEDKEKILYRRRDNVGEPSDLCLVDLNGKVEVLARAVADTEVIISPDERFIAYSRVSLENNTTRGTYIIDLNNPRQQVGPLDFTPISWTEDNSQLLVQSEEGLSVIELPNGQTRMNIQIPEGKCISDIKVAPNRKFFCFTTKSMDEKGTPGPSEQVHLASLDLLTEIGHSRPFSGGFWSPNGRYLVYGPPKRGPNKGDSTLTVFDMKNHEEFTIVVRPQYPIGGSSVAMFHHDYMSPPTWSPDGKCLILIEHQIEYPKGRKRGVNCDVIWVIDLDERRIVQEFANAFYPHPIVFSPDGHYLAAKAHYTEGNDKVSNGWILDVKTGERRRLELSMVTPVAWLTQETVLWTTRQPWMGESVPKLELFETNLIDKSAKQIFPK